MTAISAPPGNLHFPLLNLGAASYSEGEPPQTITGLAGPSRVTLDVEASPSRSTSSPKAPSRLSSLHSISQTSLVGSSPTKSKKKKKSSTRDLTMAGPFSSSSAVVPLSPDFAPPQPQAVSTATSACAPSALEPAAERKPSSPKRGKKVLPTLYNNPELASLSTPELHLASEALTGLEDQRPEARLKTRWQAFLPGTRGASAESKQLSLSTANVYSSIQAVMTSSTPGKRPSSSSGPNKVSEDSTRSSNAEAPARRASPSMLSASGSDKVSSDGGGASGTTSFFKRRRRWSATAAPLNEIDPSGQDDTVQTGSHGKALSDEDMTELLDDDAHESTPPSIFTTVSRKESASTTTVSGANANSSVASVSSSHSESVGVVPTSSSDASGPNIFKLREQTHEAAVFLYQELNRLALDDLQGQRNRLARLGIMARTRPRLLAGSTTTDYHRELISFWEIVSDGILLCLLIRHLASQAADLPDATFVPSSSIANLKYYLRTAKDVFGLQQSQLFDVPDMQTQTMPGLERVVHSILALRGRLQRASNRTSTSPPRTPIAPIPEGQSAGTIPFPTDVPGPSPQRKVLPAVQQHRLMAERKLMGDAGRNRKMSDVAMSGPRTPSLVIVEPHRDDGGYSNAGMIYRDRKGSESVASLTGVVEEESEAGDADISGAFESPDVSMDLSRLNRSTSQRHSLGTPNARAGAPMRRMSTETSGGLPSSRTFRLSFDGSSDLTAALNTGSPRLGPVRRHSSVARSPGLSSLNPQRDAPSSSFSDVGLESTPRVPFPRSNSTYDSPSRRPGSNPRYTSMSGAMASTPAEPRPASSEVGTTNSASPSRSRPSFRHHRYSSDLHLPSAARVSGYTRSDVSIDGQLGRSRVDSEVGSIFTSASFTTQDEAGRPKLQRDLAVPSKHKLVVTEGGRTVTYQIGQCIGRGQFGSVYKALNTTTGMMLAVKRIKLGGKSEKEIMQLMKEVDLLKKLEHPSVVKYEGLVRSYDVLSIILEWVESGSLYLTLKSFGPFEEGLCASYVVQILEGLHYLHNRQVVHCDLKAANILTTKKGNIKLSDFGVSLNLQAMENIATRKDAVGTPNWMAPEVIELRGASTASDIWSLGCTIIEMLTGKPPYHDHNGLSAMYRIVEDECPPIPPKVSEPLRDFLRLCFQKEPTHRPSAETLFEHQWLKRNWTGHKQLKSKDSVPFLRRISADMRRNDLDTIDAASDNAMERSSSSPPETIGRGMSPESIPARTSVYQSNALAMRAPHSQSMDHIHALPAPAPIRIVTSPVPLIHHSSDVDSYFGHTQGGSMPSPSVDQHGFLANPSMLDLESTPHEEARPHQFVKISFSKAVQCKMCWTHVKKHAVYCEGCGIVCHPSCASTSESMCSIRASAAAANAAARSSHERRRAAAGSRAETASPSSPLLPPTIFRLPFSRNRRNSSAVTNGPESPSSNGAVSPPLLPPSPLISQGGSGGNRDASGKRNRRISLVGFGRQRSDWPGLSSPDVLRSPSQASARAFAVTPVPIGTTQMVGSLSSSGSSTVSRGVHEVADLTKAHAVTMATERTLVASPAMISTPHLAGHGQVGVEPGRMPRRLSVGMPYLHHASHVDGPKAARGHVPSHSISVVYTRDTDQSDVVPGAAHAQSDRRRFKRASKECIIM